MAPLFFFWFCRSCNDITFALIMRQRRRQLQDDFVILGAAGEIALRIDSLCHVHCRFATNLPTLILEPEYTSISKARISSYSSDRIHSVRFPVQVLLNQLVTLNFSSWLISLNMIEYERLWYVDMYIVAQFKCKSSFYWCFYVDSSMIHLGKL